MRCQEIMSRNISTMPIESTVEQAARLMRDKGVGFLPLVDKSGIAVGTVTDRDIVVNCVAKGNDCRNTRLSEFGGNQVICCLPEDDVSKASDLMKQNKIQRILVCDQQKKPVGVISLQDLAQREDERAVGQTVQQVKEGAPSSIH
jgi:CBS domain-containing protein